MIHEESVFRPISLASRAAFTWPFAVLMLFSSFLLGVPSAQASCFEHPSTGGTTSACPIPGLSSPAEFSFKVDSIDCFPCVPTSLASINLQIPKCEVGGLRFFHVDVDADGDRDLVALAPVSRLWVWMNDGRGHYTRRLPTTAGISQASSCGWDLAEDGAAPLWQEPFGLFLNWITSEVRLSAPPVDFPVLEDISPRSPRAPPTFLS